MREVIVGYHQPNFFPWVGYFSKVVNCNHFVTAISIQFEKRGYQNRTRIRTADGWDWLTVPVLTKGRFDQMISEVEIDNSRPWKDKHIRALHQHYHNAKYFDEYWLDYEKLYAKDWYHLSSFNQAGIQMMLKQLGINGIDIRFHSDWEFTSAEDSTDRILQICQQLHATKYLAGKSGSAYMDMGKFVNTGVEVVTQDFEETVRDQVYQPFEPAMSAVDLIFNLGPWAQAYLRTCGGYK